MMRPRRKWQPPNAAKDGAGAGRGASGRMPVDGRRIHQSAQQGHGTGGTGDEYEGGDRVRKHQHIRRILWGAVLGNMMSRGSPALPRSLVPINNIRFDNSHDHIIEQMLCAVSAVRVVPPTMFVDTVKLVRLLRQVSNIQRDCIALSGSHSDTWPTYASRTYWEELLMSPAQDLQIIPLKDGTLLSHALPLLRVLPCAFLPDYRITALAVTGITHYHWSAFVAAVVLVELVRAIFDDPTAGDSGVNYVDLYAGCAELIEDYCVRENFCPDQNERALGTFKYYWDLASDITQTPLANFDEFQQRISKYFGNASETDDKFTIDEAEKNILLAMALALALVRVFVDQRDLMANTGFEEVCRTIAGVGGLSCVAIPLAGALYCAYVWTDMQPLPTHLHQEAIEVDAIIIDFSDHWDPSRLKPLDS